MAVAFRGAGTPATVRAGSGQASISITPNLPDGWQPGDVSVLIIDYSTATPTAPVGWDQVTTFKAFPYHGIFTRTLQSGDVAPTITYSNPFSFASLGGVHMVFSGVNAVRPPMESLSVNTRGSSAQGGPVTTTYPGEVALNIAFSLSATWGTPSGWTNIAAYKDSVYSNDNYGVSASYIEVSQPSTVTAPTITNDSSSSSVLVNFALLPAPAPGDATTGRGSIVGNQDAVSGTGFAPASGSGAIVGNKDAASGTGTRPAFRAAGTAGLLNVTTAATRTLVIPAPAWQPGDLAIMTFMVGRNTAPAVTPPTGWTQLAAENLAGASRTATCYLFYRFVQDGDTAPSITLAVPTNTTLLGRIACYAGYSPDNFRESMVITEDTVGSGNPINFPAVATATPYATVLDFSFYNNNTTATPASGYTERIDNGGNTSTTSYAHIYLMERQVAAASSVAAVNTTLASATGDKAKTITLVLAQPLPFALPDAGASTSTFYVRSGGTWRLAQSLWVRSGGTWKQVQALHANSGGTWKRVL